MAPMYFLPQLKNSSVTYFLFLPAGIKLFAVLIFRWRGALGTGLAIFARLIFTDSSQPLTSWLLAAASVTLALYLVVEYGLKLMKVDRDLSNLQYYQIVVLATATSIVNGFVFAYVVSALTIGQMSGGLFHSGFTTVMSNFAGNAIVVCLAMLIVKNKLIIINFIKGIKN